MWGIDRAVVLWQILTQEILKKDAAVLSKGVANFDSRNTQERRCCCAEERRWSLVKIPQILLSTTDAVLNKMRTHRKNKKITTQTESFLTAQ